jgi:hypothetical protein
MGIKGGPNRLGLWPNADFANGTVDNFTMGEYVSTGGPDGYPYVKITGGGGSGYLGPRIEVDPTKSYQQVIYAKTFSPGSSGNNPGGHIGFACYDQYDNFIDLRNNGGLGNTVLSRAANPGDTSIFLQSGDGWYQGADVTNHTYYFRQILLFPASHTDYGTPHHYTRFNGMRYSSLVQTGTGDWEMVLENGTLPDYGYALPSGTPVSRGAAGGSYNYALGAPTYPTEWTRYSTPVFTGSNRNSGHPFRNATKYVRFLILRNYNRRSESTQDHVWGLSKIFFGQVVDGRVYGPDKI